jgi:hypothetical protein
MVGMNGPGIRQDPVILKLLSKLPSSQHASFSDDQLLTLKAALSGRSWGVHAVDLRWRLGFWRFNYYFVFLAGRDQRELTRREQELAILAKALLLAGFTTFSILLGLLVLYLLKSAMGIDIFPGFSLGIWGWFKGHVLSAF